MTASCCCCCCHAGTCCGAVRCAPRNNRACWRRPAAQSIACVVHSGAGEARQQTHREAPGAPTACPALLMQAGRQAAAYTPPLPYWPRAACCHAKPAATRPRCLEQYSPFRLAVQRVPWAVEVKVPTAQAGRAGREGREGGRASRGSGVQALSAWRSREKIRRREHVDGWMDG